MSPRTHVACVEFTLMPDRRDEFLPLMLDNARASRERESGCRRFDVCVDPQRPERVFLYEVYDDRAAFEAHLQSEHLRRFDAETRALVASKSANTWQLLR